MLLIGARETVQSADPGFTPQDPQRKLSLGADGMAQGLRALATLTKDPCLNPMHPHDGLQAIYSNFRRSDALFWPLHTCGA